MLSRNDLVRVLPGCPRSRFKFMGDRELHQYMRYKVSIDDIVEIIVFDPTSDIYVVKGDIGTFFLDERYAEVIFSK